MSTHSLFSVLDAAHRSTVTVYFNERRLEVPAGCSVAAALLAAGVERFRTTPVSGAPRAPYCMMGVCFECLVEIDGMPSRQSCLIEVRDGMRIRAQEGARELSAPQAVATEPAHG